MLRTQLEAEGVGVASTKTDPPPPVIIAPVQERLAYDIAIPITKPGDLAGPPLQGLRERMRVSEATAEPATLRSMKPAPASTSSSASTTLRLPARQ